MVGKEDLQIRVGEQGREANTLVNMNRIMCEEARKGAAYGSLLSLG